VFDKGGRQTANLTSLPNESTEKAPDWISLNYLDALVGEGIPDVEYEIHFDKGPVLTGTLDESGKARHENVENRPVKKVVYKPRKPKDEKPHDPLRALLG
jgi:type VI secretion system secreted protein VgrG